MSPLASPHRHSLRVHLLRDRLHGRCRRLERVVAELRTRAATHADGHGIVPLPLQRSLREFEDELGLIRRELRRLDGELEAL